MLEALHRSVGDCSDRLSVSPIVTTFLDDTVPIKRIKGSIDR